MKTCTGRQNQFRVILANIILAALGGGTGVNTMMYISGNKERCVQIAAFMIENNATVRGAAKKFGISKSTVHKDVTQTLRQINKPLYFEVKKVLEINKRERHIRGGEATRRKYSAMSGQSNRSEETLPKKQTQ